VLTPLEKVEQHLRRVSKAVKRKDDQATLARRPCGAGLLRQQGKSLETFGDSGKSVDGYRYETARKAACKEISGLLQLEQE
jgi:hypothetical protein